MGAADVQEFSSFISRNAFELAIEFLNLNHWPCLLQQLAFISHIQFFQGHLNFEKIRIFSDGDEDRQFCCPKELLNINDIKASHCNAIQHDELELWLEFASIDHTDNL